MTPDTPKPPAPAPASPETLEQRLRRFAERAKAKAEMYGAYRPGYASHHTIVDYDDVVAVFEAADALRRLQELEKENARLAAASPETLEQMAQSFQELLDSEFARDSPTPVWQGVHVEPSLVADLRAGADALRRLHAASSASFSSQPSAVPAVNVNQHPAPATDESRHPSVPNGEDSGQSGHQDGHRLEEEPWRRA